MQIFEKRIIEEKEQESEPSAKTILKLENVSKKYGDFTAVNKINIKVKEGETIGLVGPNGAGKTTTIKMIAKLLKPSSGKILILNNEGEFQNLHSGGNDVIRRGFLIDVPFFYKDMTAYQHLRFFARSQHYPKNRIDHRVNYLLKLFKLEEWKYEKVKSFSKGMRQKLGIIQSILVDPKIVFLDEPQTGLDPKARVEIRKVLRELQSMGKTIFVASHMLHEISEVCDKIALINHGKIVAFDKIGNLEKKLKIKEIKSKILNPIPEDKIEIIIEKMVSSLSQYLDREIDQEKGPIQYNPSKRLFEIYYNGKAEARAIILEKLITNFKKDFQIISFSEPETTQLERIYEEMITDDGGA